MNEKAIKKLNRYTTLPVLLDILQRKKITLLNPDSWEDRNDSEVILEYRKRKNINGLYAICFSYGDETIHHWKTYANGSSGCCIEFDANALIEIVKKISELRFGIVEYMKLTDIEKKRVRLDKLPFLKRWPYRCEEEFRIIALTNTNQKFYEIDIPLNIINKITISQQMPQQIYKTIKGYLVDVQIDPESKIYRSTLYENNRWISRFKRS